jgi:adenylate cyclase class 2
MQSGVETEVKIPIGEPAEILCKIREAGFETSVERLFEANTLYDKPDKELKNAGMLLRLREVGGKNLITWKGQGAAGPHKARPEIETTLGSAEVLGQILEKLGFERSFRYEKFRTEFRKGKSGDVINDGVITLDETPIGNFLELEGPGDWIDATAGQLGFTQTQYVLESYGRLYLEDCERRGVPPANMTFSSEFTKSKQT